MANEAPLEGTIKGSIEIPKPIAEPAKVGDVNIAPTTTAAQDRTKAGQRFVNLIWETMQALIAASVVGATLYVSGKIALLMISPEVKENQAAFATTAFMLISNLASLIVGFYFGRTNHQKTGGVASDDIGR